MKFDHFLTDPWALHPVVNSRNICFGGGGGDAPEVPDYSQYISNMTSIGGKLTGWGNDLYKWAQGQGVKLDAIGTQVGDRAGMMADESGAQYTDAMKKWKGTYGDLYDAQAADAKRMIGELPKTEEQYAGKYGADAGQAFDASREAQERSLRSYGLKAPGSGAQALDATVRNQRGLGQVAAAEQGRLAARNEARDVTGKAINAGLAFPQVAGQGASTSLAAGNQQIGAPIAATSASGAAFNPALQAHQVALPYMKAWGDTMANSYNQRLAGYQVDESTGGGGLGAMLGGLAGTAAGSFLGPIGSSVGGSIGSKLGTMVAAEGGRIDDQEGGDQVVTPDMSASQGAITDDVPARLNVGEFVLPKRFVEWKGEEWIQKEIAKADKQREQNTVAEPEMAQASAIDMQAPQFQSGEAPL